MQHAVLHVDQAGEGQMRQHVPPVRHVLHQAEEDAIGRQHFAALHQRQPVVQALAQRALDLAAAPGPASARSGMGGVVFTLMS